MSFYILPCAAPDPIKSEIAQIASLTRACSFARNFLKVVLIVLVAIKLGSAQSLEAKLAARADFTPDATSSKEQLVEVARHYGIPMGIEWIDMPSPGTSYSSVDKQPTVRDMIRLIVRRMPGYRLKIRDGIVNISYTSYAVDARNFLNIRIVEYHVNRENVFGAQALLRLNIHRALHPELYAGGSNGGYGYGVPRDDTFNLKNISFSARNVTVRDILNRIVTVKGNAAWLIELTPERMMKGEPFFAQNGPIDFSWRIIPLEVPANKQSR